MTIAEWLRAAEARLEGNPDARADAVWIAEEVLSLPRSHLRMEGARALTDGEFARLEEALARRASGEPVQYVFSRAPFMGFEFYVDQRVLIPRMDTETLCDAARQFLRKRPGAAVLDLCAGSGAIGLSLKKLCPGITLTLSDLSKDASDVQKINAEGLSGVEILTGDLFATVPGRRFDLIVCNPPYVVSGEIASLQSEVLREPRMALDGGADGLDFYRAIAREYREHLDPGGRIYLEIGCDQAERVSALLEGASLLRDLNGLPRVIYTEV